MSLYSVVPGPETDFGGGGRKRKMEAKEEFRIDFSKKILMAYSLQIWICFSFQILCYNICVAFVLYSVIYNLSQCIFVA